MVAGSLGGMGGRSAGMPAAAGNLVADVDPQVPAARCTLAEGGVAVVAAAAVAGNLVAGVDPQVPAARCTLAEGLVAVVAAAAAAAEVELVAAVAVDGLRAAGSLEQRVEGIARRTLGRARLEACPARRTGGQPARRGAA